MNRLPESVHTAFMLSELRALLRRHPRQIRSVNASASLPASAPEVKQATQPATPKGARP